MPKIHIPAYAISDTLLQFEGDYPAWKEALLSLPKMDMLQEAYNRLADLRDNEPQWTRIYRLCIPLIGEAIKAGTKEKITGRSWASGRISLAKALTACLERYVMMGYEEAAHLCIEYGAKVKLSSQRTGILIGHCAEIRSMSLVATLRKLKHPFHTYSFYSPYKALLDGDEPDLVMADYIYQHGAEIDNPEEDYYTLDNLKTITPATKWLLSHKATVTLHSLSWLITQLKVQEWGSYASQFAPAEVFAFPEVIARPSYAQHLLAAGLVLPPKHPGYAQAFKLLLPAFSMDSSTWDDHEPQIERAHAMIDYYLERGVTLSEFDTTEIQALPGYDRFKPSDALLKKDRFNQRKAKLSEASPALESLTTELCLV